MSTEGDALSGDGLLRPTTIPDALQRAVAAPGDAPDAVWLLEHGQYWQTGADPERGALRLAGARSGDGMSFPRSRCFDNVRRLVEADPWFTYVEGVATNTPVTAEWHAWAVTPSGFVLDPTWHRLGIPPVGQTYYGAPFTAADLEGHPEAFEPHEGMVAAIAGGRGGGTLTLATYPDSVQDEIAAHFRQLMGGAP